MAYTLKGVIVDLRINETLQTGAVSHRTYRGCASVSLFLDFTINHVIQSFDNHRHYLIDDRLRPNKQNNNS